MSRNWISFDTPPSYAEYNENYDFNFFRDSYMDDVLHSPLGSPLKLYKGRPDLTDNEDGEDIRGVIQQVTSDNQDSSKIRQILCKVGTLGSGNYIKQGNNYWLVVGLVDNNKFYEKAVMYYCNWVLKFKVDDSVVEYPVYCVNATQYNSGVTSVQTKLNVGSSQYSIYIQSNDETDMVSRDTRFLIDKNNVNPTAYKLTQIDTTSRNFPVGGTNTWMIAECQTQYENDNIENGVADDPTIEIKEKELPQNHNISDKNEKLLEEWT